MDEEYYYEDDEYGDYYGEQEYAEESPQEANYATAKGLLQSNPAECIRLMTEVIANDAEHGVWTFKAEKAIMRAARATQQYEEMMKHYKLAITFSHPDVNQAALQKAMTKFTEQSQRVPPTYLHQIIDLTLEVAGKDKQAYGRLWFNTLIRRVNLFIDEKEYTAALKDLQSAEDGCNTDDHPATSRSSQLYSINALRLRVYDVTRQYGLLRETFFQTMCISTALVPQRVTAGVLECGGHMYLRVADWHAAFRAFTAAFRGFSEGGDASRPYCLKMAVLCDMLCGSPLDGFASNDTKPLAELPSVQPIVKLLAAFLRNDVGAAIAIVKDPAHREVFVDDANIAPYVEPLLFRLRLNRLALYCTSFIRCPLSDLAKQLVLSSEEVARLCTFAVLEGLLNAVVDDTSGFLYVYDTAQTSELQRVEALRQWSNGMGVLVSPN